jgi:type II secretory pathway component PulF
MSVLITLAPFYILFFTGFMLLPFLRKNVPPAAVLMDFIIVHIPLLRTVVIKLDMLRFSTVFKTTLVAGVNIKEMLKLSIDACVNSFIQNQVRKLESAVEEGDQLSVHMKNISLFPDTMLRMFETGEKGGKLEETTEKITEYFYDEVTNALTMLVRGLTFAIYFAIMIFVAYNIITMALDAYKPLKDVL